MGELQELNVAAVFSTAENAENAQHLRNLLDVEKVGDRIVVGRWKEVSVGCVLLEAVFYVDQTDGPFGKASTQRLQSAGDQSTAVDVILDGLAASDVDWASEIAFVFFSMGRTDALHPVRLSHLNVVAALLQLEYVPARLRRSYKTKGTHF